MTKDELAMAVHALDRGDKPRVAFNFGGSKGRKIRRLLTAPDERGNVQVTGESGSVAVTNVRFLDLITA